MDAAENRHSLLSPPDASRVDSLLPGLRDYAKAVIVDAGSISSQRREVLGKAVAFVRARGSVSHLHFICTHNSRRSHLSHVWAHVAAFCYRRDGVKTYSGGTEATACNERTVAAFARAGFRVDSQAAAFGDNRDAANPAYEVGFAASAAPIRVYSKVYSDLPNPQSDFAAMMCCSDVDEQCPVVHGAAARIPLHYLDPKAADDTPDESTVYDQRCREIAAEMFYLMASLV